VGNVHGAIDDAGHEAVEEPHHSSDLHATIYPRLRLNHETLEITVLVRTMRLVKKEDPGADPSHLRLTACLVEISGVTLLAAGPHESRVKTRNPLAGITSSAEAGRSW
jgi:hypothetical protein